MCKPYNYMAQVASILFVYLQIAIYSFVATWLCLYFWRYWLIFKDLIWKSPQFPQPVGRVTCLLYSSYLIIFFEMLQNLPM